MSDKTTLQHTYRLLGDLLDYPTPVLADQTHECIACLESASNQTGLSDLSGLVSFLEFIKTTDLGRLEEIYTGTFDVNPACYIFAGYMLFGESFDRGKFLVRLQERYRERDFEWGNELADHIPIILRFLGQLDPEEELAQNLVDKCLVPVLRLMHNNFKPDDPQPVNPYAAVLQTTLAVLESQASPDCAEAEEIAPGWQGEQPFLTRRPESYPAATDFETLPHPGCYVPMKEV